MYSRRSFLKHAACALAAPKPQRIIDIHQHTNYWNRSDAGLIAHQANLGVTKTVLLPAGSQLGLEANCYGNDSVLALTKRHPDKFVFFANELPNLPETKAVIEKYLKAGAIGIGEQKFPVECDSAAMHLIADLAQAFRVPVLIHFQHGKYNMGFERFYRMLEKYPRVTFIAHAQTWWGNIGKLDDPNNLYPTGKVTPGGLSDKWLADYPNLFGDLSAGSGLRALARDEDFTRGFLARHQNKLVYGSDCQDIDTQVKECCGSRMLTVIKRLAPDEKAVRKMLYDNAKRVLKIR